MKFLIFLIFLIFLSQVFTQETNSKKVYNSIECTVCKWMAEEIEKWIEEEKTVEEIQKLLEKVCIVYPIKIREACDSIIEDYLPKIIEWIKQNEKPLTLCEYLKLCN
ncbi:saposin b domain-containing protein [Anaeramoeba flamelloides]|uniref:Saposin b domain-containing protein n=1 Tax=Anaeramoeba flamelloides TaxID=1746091 RepID=A0AAV7YDL8_9EUKA|nr:saposin b domain-containing protein [Anaeramoeba flamelloides]|eukprot:Anaeramoba_flamelloidesa809674_54.p1 GENE.a809674_54~~a809674_54.p1  ORF type:complete len:107 (-),score=25.61 a809674_54:114-434(-)